MWKSLAEIGGVLLLVVIIFSATFMWGYSTAEKTAEVKILQMQNEAQQSAADHKMQVAGLQKQLQDQKDELDAKGAAREQAARAEMQTTIDSLNAGTKRLRSQLQVYVDASGRVVPSPTGTPDLSAASGLEVIGLRTEDATFLVRYANDAREQADALKMCVNLYQNAQKASAQVQ